jgi:hypothetical protein
VGAVIAGRVSPNFIAVEDAQGTSSGRVIIGDTKVEIDGVRERKVKRSVRNAETSARTIASIRVGSFLRSVVVLLLVLVLIPAVPFHCCIEVGDADAKVGNIRPEDLTWCADRIIQLFLPTVEPLFLDLISKARR